MKRHIAILLASVLFYSTSLSAAKGPKPKKSGFIDSVWRK